MKTFQKFTLLLILIGLLTFGLWNLKTKATKTSVPNERVVQEFKAGLAIQDGTKNQTFEISQYIGKTALEATEAVLNGNLKTSGTGQNAFVTSLADRSADTKKHEFWELDVNGSEAQVGAGSYVIQNNDNIIWKINTFK